MEKFEMRKGGEEGEEEEGPDRGRLPFIVAMATVLLVTAAALFLLHAPPFSPFATEEESSHVGAAPHSEKLTAVCEPDFCNTPDCVRIAARVQKWIKPAADPCTDLYEVACGGHRMPAPDNRETFTQRNEAQARIYLDLQKVFEETKLDESDDILMKMKTFYDTCMNSTQRDAEEQSTAAEFLADVGLNTTASSTYAWKQAVSRLEGYALHALFEPRFTHDTLEVRCALPYLPADLYLGSDDRSRFLVKLYREGVDSVLLLAAGSEHALTGHSARRETVDSIVSLETDVARLILNTHDAPDLSAEQVETLRAIWRPHVGESTMSRLRVVSGCPALPAILQLLDRNPPELVQRYVGWRALQLTLPQQGQKLRLAGVTLLAQLPGWKFSHAQPFAVCADTLAQEAGVAAAHALKHHGFIAGKEHVEQFQSSFEDLKKNFAEVIHRLDPEAVDNATKTLLLEKVQDMHLTLGYPDVYDRPGMLEKLYDPTHNWDFSSNHLENALKLMENKRKYFFARLYRADFVNPESDVDLEHSPLDAVIRYDKTTNTINADYGVLLRPITAYTKNVPKYLEYGDIQPLAKAMSTAIADFVRSRHSDLFPARCLSQQIRRISNTSPSRDFIEEIEADILSLMVTYEGVSGHLKEWKSDKPLPSLTSLTHKQMFFVQAGQKFCEKWTESSFSSTYGKPFTPKIRLNIAASNLEHFGFIFECPAGSPMNPENKCSHHMPTTHAP